MIDAFAAFSDFLLKKVVLLAQIFLTFAFNFKFLLNRFDFLPVLGMNLSCMVKLLSIAGRFVFTLLELALDLVSSLLNGLDLGTFTINIRFDLRHLICKLVEWCFNLLALTTQLFCQLAYLHIHLLKLLLLCLSGSFKLG